MDSTETRVRLVEQHVIKPTNLCWPAIDSATFASKNLYNLANYYIRQAYIHEHHYLPMKELYALLKGSDAYTALPRKVSNQVFLQVYHNWGAYYESLKTWRIQPELFLGRPGIPKYKKKDGRNLLVYEKGAISRDRKVVEQGIVRPSQLEVDVISDHSTTVEQVRIVPRKGFYVIEVVYSVTVQPNPKLDMQFVAGIDIGVNNLAALSSNKPGFSPLLVNGRPLKAINQYYNKRRAELQSILTRENANRRSSHRLARMERKRTGQINHYLHTASRRIIDHLEMNGVGVLVIGRNKNWKQKAGMGSRNNQNFVQIPFARFIAMLTYKAKLAGIEVIEQEESYTSKCSFLDMEEIRRKEQYVGRRTNRGLFVSSSGRKINADLNGSYNIIRKAIPNAFRNGIEGVAVHPAGFTL
jgi:putative transposase